MKITCPVCNGTGEQPVGTLCPRCLGAKEIESDFFESTGLKLVSYMDKFDDITGILDEINETVSIIEILANLSPTCKVVGCMDSTEYLALSNAAKDGVKTVLSCGFVDMRDGQWARTTLFAIFGAQSVTRAALIAMFG